MPSELPRLRLSLQGVKEEIYQWQRWLGDNIYSHLNSKTLSIAAVFSMKYGQALERLIREVVIDEPAQGPMHNLKADDSDSFYRIFLRPMDAPELGQVFPLEVEDKELVAMPITLHMGWKNSPPIFFTATETVADLENLALR